jgi:hypothetical protein
VQSQYVEPHHAVQLLEDGAGGGYLLKDRVTDVNEVVDAVRRVAAGGSVIDLEVVAQLVGRRRTRDPIQELSECERQVLALMAEGRSPTRPSASACTSAPRRWRRTCTASHPARPARRPRRPSPRPRRARVPAGIAAPSVTGNRRQQ